MDGDKKRGRHRAVHARCRPEYDIMKVKDAYLLFTPPILNELCFRENITGKYNKLIDRLYGALF